MEFKQILKDAIARMASIKDELFKSGDINELIISYVELFTKIATAIQELESEKVDLEEYNEKLTKLLGSLEIQDYDLFADIIEFEVKPLLEYWQSVV